MELPHIGKNCNFAQCNKLDFLPFPCDGCGNIYCQDHRLREQHNCTAPLAEAVDYVGEKSYPCTVSGCDKRELTPIVCHHCELSFCLSHRLQEDHSCAKLPEKRPDVSKTSQHVQEILAQKETKPRPKPTNPKAIQMAAKIALMKLKGKAVGDQGLPQSERIYFNVVLPLESKKQTIPLFFSKVWTIGRLIDVIADKASITNNNNTGAEKKLRLFHADLGFKLPTDKQLSEIMDDEANFLLNGSTVILENVSDDIDILNNLSAYKT